jgi:hypothetical protein
VRFYHNGSERAPKARPLRSAVLQQSACPVFLFTQVFDGGRRVNGWLALSLVTSLRNTTDTETEGGTLHLLRIEAGEEVIRRHCILPKSADEQTLRTAIQKAVAEEGYELDPASLARR